MVNKSLDKIVTPNGLEALIKYGNIADIKNTEHSGKSTNYSSSNLKKNKQEARTLYASVKFLSSAIDFSACSIAS